jgi:transaldolase
MAHFMGSLNLECNIITAPYMVLNEWLDNGFPLFDKHFAEKTDLEKIVYKDNLLNSQKNWETMDLEHELTTKGIERFCNDWKALLR